MDAERRGVAWEMMTQRLFGVRDRTFTHLRALARRLSECGWRLAMTEEQSRVRWASVWHSKEGVSVVGQSELEHSIMNVLRSPLPAQIARALVGGFGPQASRTSADELQELTAL